MTRFGLSERHACGLVRASRTMFHYKPRFNELNEAIRKRLRELTAKHKRYGVWKFCRIIRRESDGKKVNHKRIERLYRLEGLSLRIRKRKKLKSVTRVELPAPTRPNERWSMDFVHDKLWGGCRFRCLTVVDMFTRECLAIETDRSLPGERVRRILEGLIQQRGKPTSIVVDNGPEFISQVLDEWAYRSQVDLAFIRPGKPTDNAYVESFNGKFREECLNTHYFSAMQEARKIIEGWRVEYNTYRPHRALNGLTPQEFVVKYLTGNANFQVA